MVMIEDNPYDGVQFFAVPSDVDGGAVKIATHEDRDSATEKAPHSAALTPSHSTLAIPDARDAVLELK